MCQSFIINLFIILFSDPDWRRWIHNTAIPTFEWNACDTKKHARETVNMFAEKCDWDERFSWLKRWFLRNTLTSEIYSLRNEYKYSM